MRFDQKLNKTENQNNNSKDFFHEESLCITEENRYDNQINPIKLADLGWGDDYKLDKLIRQQAQSVSEGKFDPEAFFGGVPPEEIEEAFSTFETIRKEIGDQLLRRKSSIGGTFGMFGTTNQIDDTKY